MHKAEQADILRGLLEGCLSHHFGVQDKDFHSFVEDNAEYLNLNSGDVLITQGERCDAVYFLLSGHLRALVKQAGGKSIAVGEIGRGETVGELALFTGKPRGADVVAVRDSIVAKLPSDILEKAISKQPQLAFKITRQIIERYERTQAISAPPIAPVNITILPISPGVNLDGFVSKLVEVRNKEGDDILVIDSGYVSSQLGGLDAPDIALPRGAVSLAISDLELRHSGLFFVASPDDPAWCQTAIHHSDEILLICDAGHAPELTEIERRLLYCDENIRAQTSLVLLHEENSQSPTNTAQWLRPRKINRHFHVRKTLTRDYVRLNRILSGRGRGLVLAGGGARGMSHLGVMTALGEAGMEFDFIGGTSIGAIMGSFASMDVRADKLRDVTRDIFVNSPFGKISGDYNFLPLLSLIKGERAWQVSNKAVLDNAGSNIDIEDTWKTFFAIASNFTTHQEQVLTQGSLAQNVMASFSIPGLMPPSLIDGQLLFDGGSFNNFPVDHMRKMGARYIVGVDLLSDRVFEHEIDEIPSAKQVLRDRFRSKKKRQYHRLPSLPNTLLTASVVTSIARQKHLREHVDILIQPNTRGVSLLDWHKYDELFERAKQDTLEKLKTIDPDVIKPFFD